MLNTFHVLIFHLYLPLVKRLFTFYGNLLLDHFFFLSMNFKRFKIYILDISPFSNMCFGNIFFHWCRIFFILFLLTVSFGELLKKILIKINTTFYISYFFLSKTKSFAWHKVTEILYYFLLDVFSFRFYCLVYTPIPGNVCMR